jgi:hypothetical protein
MSYKCLAPISPSGVRTHLTKVEAGRARECDGYAVADRASLLWTIRELYHVLLECGGYPEEAGEGDDDPSASQAPAGKHRAAPGDMGASSTPGSLSTPRAEGPGEEGGRLPHHGPRAQGREGGRPGDRVAQTTRAWRRAHALGPVCAVFPRDPCSPSGNASCWRPRP